jgi:hypothetical protein
MAQSPKLKLKAEWNRSGFHVVTALPRGLKFNAGHYTSEILDGIKSWWTGHEAGSTRKVIVHAGNARHYVVKL